MSDIVSGTCDNKFNKLKQIFISQFNNSHELGASISVEHNGREVVNLFGGYEDQEKNKLWSNTTLVNVWSVSKAITGICINKLIYEGKLDVNRKVEYYWPEYSCNGKSSTKVIDFLTHRSGMYGFQNGMPLTKWTNWNVFVSELEKQSPYRVPGQTQSYHAITFAWLIGELFKRAEGRSIGQYFKEEIAIPFDLDIHMGLTDDKIERCSDIFYKDIGKLGSQLNFIKLIPNFLLNKDLLNFKKSIISKDFKKAFDGSNFEKYDANSIEWRKAEVPSANFHATASSLSKLFGILATGCTRDGIILFDIDTLKKSIKVHSSDYDTVLFGSRINFGYCFMLDLNHNHNNDYAPIIKDSAFGHSGIGGSVAFTDLKYNLGYAFVCNKQQKTKELYKTSNLLTQALYKALS